MDYFFPRSARPRWFIRSLAGLAGAALVVASQAAHADEIRTAVGAGIGAVAGAVIGDSIGGRSGALIGAGTGGLIGARVAQGPDWQRVSPPAPPPGAIYYPQHPVRMQPVAPAVVVAPPVYSAYPRHGYHHHHHHHRRHHHQHGHGQGPWWENGSEPPRHYDAPRGYGH